LAVVTVAVVNVVSALIVVTGLPEKQITHELSFYLVMKFLTLLEFTKDPKLTRIVFIFNFDAVVCHVSVVFVDVVMLLLLLVLLLMLF